MEAMTAIHDYDTGPKGPKKIGGKLAENQSEAANISWEEKPIRNRHTCPSGHGSDGSKPK
jgi:hypothetical protein